MGWSTRYRQAVDGSTYEARILDVDSPACWWKGTFNLGNPFPQYADMALLPPSNGNSLASHSTKAMHVYVQELAPGMSGLPLVSIARKPRLRSLQRHLVSRRFIHATSSRTSIDCMYVCKPVRCLVLSAAPAPCQTGRGLGVGGGKIGQGFLYNDGRACLYMYAHMYICI